MWSGTPLSTQCSVRGLSPVSTFQTFSDFLRPQSCVLPCITVVVVTSDEDTAGERTAEDSGDMADEEKVTQVSELTPALLQTVLRRSLASPALTVSR